MLKTYREKNVEMISQKIYKTGIEKCVHSDIIGVVIMYYMSLSNNNSIDIENLLLTCNNCKELFIDAINSQKIAIEFYSKNNEIVENMELEKAKIELIDIQIAIAIYYYSVQNGKTFYKKKSAILLFEKLVKYNNPVVQYYLGTYYATECYEYLKRQYGIALYDLAKKHTIYIYKKELEYKKFVEDTLKNTFYKNHEIATLEFTIKNAEEKVEKLSKNLERIHYIKDSLRSKAIEDIKNTIEYIYTNLSKIDSLYNQETLRLKNL